MKNNKLIILGILCGVLAGTSIYFAYRVFTIKECQTCKECPVSENKEIEKSEEKNEEAEGYLAIEDISFTQFKKKIDNKDTFYIVFSQTTCGHCIKYAPTINKVFEDKNSKVFRLELNLMKNEDHDSLENITIIQSTPTTVYFKNGKETARIVGNLSAQNLEDWLASN